MTSSHVSDSCHPFLLSTVPFCRNARLFATISVRLYIVPRQMRFIRIPCEHFLKNARIPQHTTLGADLVFNEPTNKRELVFEIVIIAF
jgi:hypothetical protein